MEENEMKGMEAAQAESRAATVGQKLRVAVSKTSAQGEEAQKSSPNLMSFSSDENSIHFNGKRYGALVLKQIERLTSGSSSDEVAAVIGAATSEHLANVVDFITAGGIVVVDDEGKKHLAAAKCTGESVDVEYLKEVGGVMRKLSHTFALHDGSSWQYDMRSEPVSQQDADVFKSALGDTVQMPSAVGGIKAGTTVAQLKGKKQNDIIDMLLFPEQQPSVKEPSASIGLKNAFTANKILEVGATAPVAADITTGFDRGTCTVAGQPNKYRAGTLDAGKSFVYVLGNINNKALPAKITLGAMQYNYKAFYGQGDTLVTSFGNKASVTPNPLPAGTKTSGAVYLYGTYPYFCNGASSSTSAQDGNFPPAPKADTKLPLQKWTDTVVGAKFASEAASGTRFEFKFPATKQVTKVEFMNTVSGKWEVFAAGNYVVSSAGDMTVQGVGVAYKKWTTQGAMSGGLQLRFTLANATARMMSDDGLDDNMIDAVLKAPAEGDGDGGIAALAADVAGDEIIAGDGVMPVADTGNRARGVASFAVNFEPGGQAPLDARLLVPTKADLVNPDTYSAKNYYKGMQVVVADTQEVYVLKDPAKISAADYSGWKRVDAGAAKTPVEDSLASTGTTVALSANQGRILNKKSVDLGLIDDSCDFGVVAERIDAVVDNGEDTVFYGLVVAGNNEPYRVAFSVFRSEMAPPFTTYKLVSGLLEDGTVCVVSITRNTNQGGQIGACSVDFRLMATKQDVDDGLAGKLNKADIVNDVKTGGPAKALSAEQGKLLSQRIDGLGSVYRVKGTKAGISEVLALTDAKKGDVWNVTGEFTLGGKKHPAGTNVVCIQDTSSSSHTEANWDALGGTVDLSPYAKDADLSAHTGDKENPHGVTKAQVGLGNVTNDAQVKRSEVVTDYSLVKASMSSSTVASSAVTGQVIKNSERSAAVVIDVWEDEEHAIEMESAVDKEGKIVYLAAQGKLAYLADGKYYYNWENKQYDAPFRRNGGSVLDVNTNKPLTDKVYVYAGGDARDGIYVYDGLALNHVGNFTTVVNSLANSRTDAALSAAQGKKLQDEKLSKTDASSTYLSKASAEGTYAKKSDLGIVIE